MKRARRFGTAQRVRAVAVAVFLGMGSVCTHGQAATNIVLFIGDGMGLEQIKAGACFTGTNLVFESWPRRGEVRTYSANSGVTDSAAGATAMATGHKVGNGVISLASPGDGRAFETVLEFVKRQGKRTGLVSTTRLTDATPAAFAAHASNRTASVHIAEDLLRRSRPNVLLGGGAAGLNVSSALQAGYAVVTNRAELLALSTNGSRFVAGLFAAGDLPFDGQTPAAVPRLWEMTRAALDLLDDGPDGLFLMVEGGRIDHACHANSITNCVREVAAFDRAVGEALAWAEGRADTLMIVTADHETGGLRVGACRGAGQAPDATWSTGGHTATNVGVYARGPGSEAVGGVMENTDIYQVMMRSLTILPAARDIRAGPDGVTTKWDARPGDLCGMDAAEGLAGDGWQGIGSASADTHEVYFADTNARSIPSRFYRLNVDR